MKNVEILNHLLTVESLLEISTNRRKQAFYNLIDVRSVTNVIGKSILSIECGILWISKVNMILFLWVNNLKEKENPAQVNRNRFDLILARRYWNCSTMENLRCPNCAVFIVIMKKYYKTVWSSIKSNCLTKYKPQ